MRRVVFSFAAVVSLGCGADRSSAAPSGSASAAARWPAASAAAPAPGAPRTTKMSGVVDFREGKARKVGFTIELPPGLRDVSDHPTVRTYAQQAKTFVGYTFEVMQANPRFVSLGLEGAVAMATSDPDAVKNKAKILEKGTTPGGFYFAHEIQEGKKRALIVILMLKKGDVSLQCRGNVEGPLADKTKESTRVIVDACKTCGPSGG
jgi:hypothetical protein